VGVTYHVFDGATQTAVGQPTAILAPDQSVTVSLAGLVPKKGRTYRVTAAVNDINGNIVTRTATLTVAERTNRAAGPGEPGPAAASARAHQTNDESDRRYRSGDAGRRDHDAAPAGERRRAEQSQVDDERGAGEAGQHHRLPDDDGALGANPAVVLDRPGRELGAEQQQHADSRRPAVDDGVPLAPDQVAAARGQDGPRDQHVPAEDQRRGRERERRAFHGDRDVREAPARGRGIRRRGAERREGAARGDQARTSRP
jgi:hypothetical protein